MYEFAVTPAVTQIRRRGAQIADVIEGGIGAELELERGDRIIKVNGRRVRDYLDFRFMTGGETQLTINVIKETGAEWELKIERSEAEDFGLDFEQITPRQCANECIFCFCKGNPDDARPALFIRDEDIRLSFLYGNYTTLTSITEDEMRRVIEQRLTPQFVSVHATDIDVRAYLLGVDRKRANIRSKLQRLIDARIEIHAQVVLCPNINDGEILKRTINDLAMHYPHISSVAIVPLGLTRYNTDQRLTPVTRQFCRSVIKQLRPIQHELRARLGTNFAFLGDEIYLRAGMSVPGRNYYGDYPQIEDGVGMVRAFEEKFKSLLRRLTKYPTPKAFTLNGTLLTGRLFAPILQKYLDELNNRFRTNLNALPITSNYFGGDVGVTGLITGTDVLEARDSITGEFIVLPRVTLKSDEAVMLDGITPEEIERSLGIEVRVLDFEGLAQMIQDQSPQSARKE